MVRLAKGGATSGRIEPGPFRAGLDALEAMARTIIMGLSEYYTTWADFYDADSDATEHTDHHTTSSRSGLPPARAPGDLGRG